MRVIVLASALGSLLFGCGSPAPECHDHIREVQACGRTYDAEVCDTKAGACSVRCSAEASCSDLDQASSAFRDDDPRSEVPAALSLCWSLCIDTFTCADDGHAIDAQWKCDGDEDCVDGSDEKGCEYFECTQGGLVSMDARCDAWPDCFDESDEEGCP